MTITLLLHHFLYFRIKIFVNYFLTKIYVVCVQKNCLNDREHQKKCYNNFPFGPFLGFFLLPFHFYAQNIPMCGKTAAKSLINVIMPQNCCTIDCRENMTIIINISMLFFSMLSFLDHFSMFVS